MFYLLRERGRKRDVKATCGPFIFQNVTVCVSVGDSWHRCWLKSKHQTVWEYLLKLNTQLTCDPEVLLLGIYPGEIKHMFIKKKKKDLIKLFVTALFITRHPLICEKVNTGYLAWDATLP